MTFWFHYYSCLIEYFAYSSFTNSLLQPLRNTAKMSRSSSKKSLDNSTDSGTESFAPYETPPVTPSSPSSKYTKSRLLDVDPARCPFRGFVLAFWDNILGPRTRHVWNVDYDNLLKSDLLSHITSQVLSCEICRDPFNCDADFKFYNLPHKGVVVPAFVFSAKGTHGMAVHSLYVVIPKTEMKFYLEIHEILQCCLQRLVGKFRVLLDKVSCSTVFYL